ncbi:MAG: universal stress protein [Eggerthellaceae bacterium]|nr:universal stress protein [Eggerthellaceae bacterium]
MSKKLLVAYDGSEPSKKALRIAEDIASLDPSIQIVLVHVMRLFSSGAAAAGIDTVIMDESASITQELAQIADSIPNPVEVRILKGSSPADLIINAAKDEGADMIIMGSRGVGGVKGYLGSVSYGVVKDSPITVMIAKEAD